MKKLAIIGTGIAGMACAYHLHTRYALTVYEKNSYAGGHTNTVVTPEGEREVPIDTGFMVYNEVTYPELTKLFRALGVKTKLAPMSFSVQHVPSGLEFSGSGFSGLFAQRRNLFRPLFWRLLREINRFNQEAPALLENPALAEETLDRYAKAHGYSDDFLDRYLIPMSSAVWSTPSNAMLEFPAAMLVRFFKNHGFLGLHTQHPWRTVEGGSRGYRDKIVAPWKEQLHLAHAATQVGRRDGKAWVRDASGQEAIYDAVILASHADESLAILGDATSQERQLLSPFHYQKNLAVLHTDTSVMPRTRRAWSSWNYRVERDRADAIAASTTYWMNRLQGVSDRQNYFVSINAPKALRPEKVLRRIEYQHPVFSVEAIRAQRRLPELNNKGPLYFCGSYFRYGFHEDALISALDVIRRLP